MKFPEKPWPAVFLTLLLILSVFFAASAPYGTPINASGALTSGDGTTSNNNLLQYEWPQLQGDSYFTRFSAGPAPEAPDILWKINLTGVKPYITAFNGKVFVTTNTDVIALNRDTGNIIWDTPLPALDEWAAVYKIDATRLIVGKFCLET